MQSSYSPMWFKIFGETVDGAQTACEVDFLRRRLPLPQFTRILDVCCGSGRHALGLAAAGYCVIGVDVNADALERARSKANESATFVECDMRELISLNSKVDAVICMWQSFGAFDDETNLAVLRGMTACLPLNGRLILDVYNPEFFGRNLGVRCVERGGHHVVEAKSITNNRLTVRLKYDDGQADHFQWRLYRIDEWHELAKSAGLRLLQACAQFDEHQPPSSSVPRKQLIFERSR